MRTPTGDAIIPGIMTTIEVETEMTTDVDLRFHRRDGEERRTETVTGNAIVRRGTIVGAEATAAAAAAAVDEVANRIMVKKAERL